MTSAVVFGYDPRTGRPVGAAHSDSTPAEVEAALGAAAAVRRSAAQADRVERIEWLRALAGGLASAAPELVSLADEETGLGRPRLESEVERTVVQIELFEQVLADGAFLGVVIDPAAADARPAPRPDLRRMQTAVGPVAVWAASNFPFAFGVLGGDTVSALAAGCPVVVKSHPSQPGLSRSLGLVAGAALRRAGAPEGVLAVLHGDPAGRLLIGDFRVKAGAFTGSTAGGRALFDLACARPDPIPFFAEMGSVNPVFVTVAAATARAEEIADGCLASVLLGGGQFCTKPGVVFVPRSSGLAGLLKERVPESTAVPMLNARMLEGFRAGTERALRAAGTGVPQDDDGRDGYWPKPRVLVVDSEVFVRQWDVLAQECFGPLCVVVEYAAESDLVALAGRFSGCLTATIHGENSDADGLRELLATLAERAGRIVWNGWPTGVAVTWAMQHGGPYPATTAAWSTSVGASAIERFLRPVAFQNLPAALLPASLQDAALRAPRRVEGSVVTG